MPPGHARLTSRTRTHLAAFFRFAPAPGQWRTALRTSAVMAVPVLVISAVAGLDVGPMALFGSLTALWDTGRPLRPRVLTFAVVACVLPGSMALGVSVSPVPWLMAPTVAAVALVAVTLYYAFVPAPGPGPLNTFFACALGTCLGAHTGKAWEIVLVTFCSCVLTALLCLTDLIRRPHPPERSAVAAARRAVHLYADLPPHSVEAALRTARDDAGRAVRGAWSVLRSAGGRGAGNAVHRALEDELLRTESVLARTLVADHFPGVTARHCEARGSQVGRPPPRQLLRRALERHSQARLVAVRNSLAAGAAMPAAQLAGLGHPYWAVLSSTVVLHSGAGRGFTSRRALHRVLGTLIGVLVVAAVWRLEPTRPQQLALQLVAVFGMNLLLSRQYTLAAVSVTVMAMMANTASSPGLVVADLFADRVVETLLGCSVALAVLWTTGRRGPRLAQIRQYHRTVSAVARLLDCVDRGEQASHEAGVARRDVAHELERHTAMLTRAIDDDPALSAWLPVDRVLGHLSHDALAAVRHPCAATELSAGAARDALLLMRRDQDPRATDPADAARSETGVDQARRALAAGLSRPPGPSRTTPAGQDGGLQDLAQGIERPCRNP
ncbi:FUSC family protein [Streptomyces sp. NBC_00059]|uniref:FUSC family protein n=1 Tax=Streptomyces sp. NBC_00059 TaxID=2975635 RepID=UPI0022546BE7|nr:FUSC family protein [Streptomyces sp. NBC_00059]MCX5416195.1 FUSC family protein [Streptomyces sp. NBC_00059]